MSNDIRNWAKTIKVGDRNAKIILLELADVSDDTGYLWHSIPVIAEVLEMSEKTVERGFGILVKKKIITRIDREKRSGKFTSKATQINVPRADLKEMHRQRKIRREKVFQPTDNLSDGSFSPTDNLSENAEKPPVNLSDGSENQQTICPKPTDNLSSGQFDGLNISNKDVLETSLETSQKDFARVRDGESPEFFGNQTGHLVSDILGETNEPFDDYFRSAVEGVCFAMNVHSLPNLPEWENQIRWAFNNKFSAEEFAECYSLMRQQTWRKGRIKPEAVSNNLPELARIRLEVRGEEKTEEIPEPDNAGPVEDLTYFDDDQPEALSSEKREAVLKNMRFYVEKGQRDFIMQGKDSYTELDWNWLMNELGVLEEV